jgi:hypothetical protein
MAGLGFIHSTERITYLVVDKVDDILPALRAAAHKADVAAGDAEVLRRL